VRPRARRQIEDLDLVLSMRPRTEADREQGETDPKCHSHHGALLVAIGASSGDAPIGAAAMQRLHYITSFVRPGRTTPPPC
jgi:hypothetical protein